jgi:hypothetical protein
MAYAPGSITGAPPQLRRARDPRKSCTQCMHHRSTSGMSWAGKGVCTRYSDSNGYIPVDAGDTCDDFKSPHD